MKREKMTWESKRQILMRINGRISSPSEDSCLNWMETNLLLPAARLNCRGTSGTYRATDSSPRKYPRRSTSNRQKTSTKKRFDPLKSQRNGKKKSRRKAIMTQLEKHMAIECNGYPKEKKKKRRLEGAALSFNKAQFQSNKSGKPTLSALALRNPSRNV